MSDAMAAEARRLRVEEGLSIQEIQRRLGVTKQRLQEWLRGVPPPAWTRRPNAKDSLRARAIELRSAGRSVNDIALELGVARSTAYQWVRHLPLDPDSDRARQKREHGRRMSDAYWAARREARAAEQATEQALGDEWVSRLTRRELLLAGAVAYWCEGAKGKPWRPLGQPSFTNSDPALIALFLDEALGGVPRASLKFRVSIHESADVAQAVEWWAARVGAPSDRFQRSTLKRHNPRTTRQNVGGDYHGCLVVVVPRGRALYWRTEGIMRGVARSLADGRLG